MEKNNQPLIFGIVAIGAVLIIALALIFTRNSDETTTEAILTDDTSENQENTSTEENGEDDQQSETPDSTPDPQPTPDPEPQPESIPEPSNGLPSNWQSLTSQQKTDLNPFNCDHATQWVSAEDGSCIDRPVVTDSGQEEAPGNNLPPVVCDDDQVELPGGGCFSYLVLDREQECLEDADDACSITLYVAVKGNKGVVTGTMLDAVYRHIEADNPENVPLPIMYTYNGSDDIDDYDEGQKLYWSPPKN